jgi:hypothetical protein
MLSFIFVLFFGLTSASHFRYGSISWEKGDGNHVHFTIETAWRRSYDGNAKGHHLDTEHYEPGQGSGEDGHPVEGDEVEITGLEWPTFDAGDGSQSYLTFTIHATSEDEDWMYGIATVDHVYKTPNHAGEAWIARFTGCCRLSELHNNNDRTWNLQAHVDLIEGTESPHVKSLPIITVPKNQVSLFYVPAVTPGNEGATEWVLANSDQLGGTENDEAHNPEGFSVADPSTGEMEIDTSGYEEGLYNAGLMIKHGSQWTPVDFLIRVLNDGGEGEAASPNLPSVHAEPHTHRPDNNGVYPEHHIDAYVGYGFDFEVHGDSNEDDTEVHITWGVTPSGVHEITEEHTHHEHENDSGDDHVESHFAWTPCQDDVGTHIVCYEATSEHGSSIQECVQIDVHPDPEPEFNWVSYDHDYSVHGMRGPIGKEMILDVHVHDANCKDIVHIEEGGSQNACRPMVPHWPTGAHLTVAIGMAYDNCQTDHYGKFSWIPGWSQGGWHGQICFGATDSVGACDGDAGANYVNSCIDFGVYRCEYTVQYEQQLQEIAAIYHTDWLTIWNHNNQEDEWDMGFTGYKQPEFDTKSWKDNNGVEPSIYGDTHYTTDYEMPHPDYLMNHGQTIFTGHKYRVNIRDNLNDIAARFGTSVEAIHHMNADLCEDSSIEVGQVICLISNPCEGAVSTTYEREHGNGHDNHWYSAAKDSYSYDEDSNSSQKDDVKGHH